MEMASLNKRATHMEQTEIIRTNEAERDVLNSALEILSPDTDEDIEVLELLTQRVMLSTHEADLVDIEMTYGEMVLAIAALDVLDPDEFEARDTAMELRDRIAVVCEQMEPDAPDL